MNCEAHWLLAYYYYKLATDIPNLLEGIQPAEQKRICFQKCGYWIGIVINAIGPIFTAVTLGICLSLLDSRPRNPVTHRPLTGWSNEMKLMYNLQLGGTIFNSLLQIVSGIILIWSINRIRVYLGKNADESGINIKTMIFHAVAFGAYLMANVASVVTFLLYLFASLNADKINETTYKFYMDLYSNTQTLVCYVSLIDTIFLCLIFWELSTVVEEEPEIEVEEEDEEEIRRTQTAMREQDHEAEL